jgi:hypothetical protein
MTRAGLSYGIIFILSFSLNAIAHDCRTLSKTGPLLHSAVEESSIFLGEDSLRISGRFFNPDEHFISSVVTTVRNAPGSNEVSIHLKIYHRAARGGPDRYIHFRFNLMKNSLNQTYRREFIDSYIKTIEVKIDADFHIHTITIQSQGDGLVTLDLLKAQRQQNEFFYY